jgi:hypothetical protein
MRTELIDLKERLGLGPVTSEREVSERSGHSQSMYIRCEHSKSMSAGTLPASGKKFKQPRRAGGPVRPAAYFSRPGWPGPASGGSSPPPPGAPPPSHRGERGRGPGGPPSTRRSGPGRHPPEGPRLGPQSASRAAAAPSSDLRAAPRSSSPPGAAAAGRAREGASTGDQGR